MSEHYTSLSEVLEAAAVASAKRLTVLLFISDGRVTKILYRRTFGLPLDAFDGADQELTASVALLRKFGKRYGRGRVPYTVRFSLDAVPAFDFATDKVKSYIARESAKLAGTTSGSETSINDDPVSELDDFIEEQGPEFKEHMRRDELARMGVSDLRAYAGKSLHVPNAWRTKKAELIDRIIQAELANVG